MSIGPENPPAFPPAITVSAAGDVYHGYDGMTLRELVARATPGPWRTNESCGDESVLGPNGAMVADCAIFGMSATFRKRGGSNVANAALIVAAVNALPDLLDRLDAERARAIAAETRLAEAVKVIGEIVEAEACYRYAHDIHGGGHSKTGRAWDLMRRAGDRARQFLNPEQS